MPYPKFTDENTSLMRKACTEAVYKECEGKGPCPLCGFTIDSCINSGVVNPDSGVGLYAGCEKCFTHFEAIFDPVIEMYHNYKKDAKHMTDMDSSKLPAVPGTFEKYVVSTRIRVGRAVAGYGMSCGISKDGRTEMRKVVTEALGELTGDLKGTYFPLDNMDEKTRQQLVDDHFLFKKGDRFLEACGANRDWPADRGIFHNDAKTFLIWVNEEDQMRIISMQKGGNVKEVFERLCKGIKAVEDVMKKRNKEYAWSAHHGFFHSCPSNVGTGMRASVHVALPHLSKQADFKEICEKLGLQPRGIHGEHSESEGGVYDVSNKHRLGYSEVELVTTMINGIKDLIEREQKLEKA